MTQSPYVPPRDDENTTDYTWPPAQGVDDGSTAVTPAEPAYTEGSYSQESYVEPVSTTYVPSDAIDYSRPTDSQSTKDVAKDQAGAVKDTAVEQGQQVAGVAKDQAGAVKDTAVEQGQHVAEVAKDQVAEVAGEASAHVKDLLSEGMTELRSQAGSQQKRLATGIHSLASELDSMASKSEKSGPLTDYAHQAANKGAEVAEWLESAEPSDVLDTLRSFARRRPAVFLAASAATGIVVGRLTRGLVANHKDETQSAAVTSTYSSSPQYAVEPARDNISLQEIPTSGTGAGYTTDAPDYVADDATLSSGTGYGTTAGYGTTTGYDGAAR